MKYKWWYFHLPHSLFRRWSISLVSSALLAVNCSLIFLSLVLLVSNWLLSLLQLLLSFFTITAWKKNKTAFKYSKEQQMRCLFCVPMLKTNRKTHFGPRGKWGPRSRPAGEDTAHAETVNLLWNSFSSLSFHWQQILKNNNNDNNNRLWSYRKLPWNATCRDDKLHFQTTMRR